MSQKLHERTKSQETLPPTFNFPAFFSRGSSVSSDDFSSLASPDSAVNDKAKPNRTKLRQKSKNTRNMEGNSSGSNGSGRGGNQIFLKRRYSVPEIIMRK